MLNVKYQILIFIVKYQSCFVDGKLYFSPIWDSRSDLMLITTLEYLWSYSPYVSLVSYSHSSVRRCLYCNSITNFNTELDWAEIKIQFFKWFYFSDSIREINKYSYSSEDAASLANQSAAKDHVASKLFRAQRNFYIVGFALFLWL